MKTLIVKDWFHEKKMNEMKRDVQTTDVFAILEETEKAYNVFVGDANSCMTYWVPKSCTEEIKAGEDGNGMVHRKTIINDDWDFIKQNWNEEMSKYR